MVMYSRDTMDKVNGGRGRNAAWGVEPSGGGWRLVGVGDVQVDGICVKKGILMGGSIREEEI